MIFGTVGGQLPFDRLVRAIDLWAASRGRADVLIQVGPSDIKLESARAVPMLAPPEFDRTFEEARVVVSHAGMGTILTALTRGKPLLVMPRRAELGEHRNDHQLATAAQFEGRPGILVAWSEEELLEKLDELERTPAPETIDGHAEPGLIAALQDFIQGT